MNNDSLNLSMNGPIVSHNASNVADSMYDYYDDDFLWKNECFSMTCLFPGSLSNDQSQVLMGDNNGESLSVLNNDMINIDNNNDMEDNAINNNEKGIFEAHYESRPSVMMMNNDG
ncbi:hypothetical protein INT45_005713 [Circinella minor]|uniref:Uncharacterized protein n=1 Tax=Circinella minor TaxID=1195481 RepID=A0A8H7S5D4_9FUNG|nr:hypothetical protein INT45_005713 [Circinella minor]